MTILTSGSFIVSHLQFHPYMGNSSVILYSLTELNCSKYHLAVFTTLITETLLSGEKSGPQEALMLNAQDPRTSTCIA